VDGGCHWGPTVQLELAMIWICSAVAVGLTMLAVVAVSTTATLAFVSVATMSIPL
jgi:hypothetical protein